MAFPAKVWEDTPSTDTPINAAGLIDLEERLSDYTDQEVAVVVASLAAEVAALEAEIAGVAGGLAGRIASTGTVTAGTGFSVTKGSTGLYTINFSPAFASVPVVHVNQIATSTLYFVGVTAVSASSASIRITTNSGTLTDQAFHFSARLVS